MSLGERFLTRPLAFASLPPAPWGSESLALDLPGGPYAITGLNATQTGWAQGHFGPLCLDPDETRATVRLGVHRLPTETFRAIDTRGWDYSFDREHHPRRLRLVGWDFVAEIGLDPDLVGRIWTSRADPDGFPGVLENCFRVLMAYRVTRLGGVLLHSGAFVRDGLAQVVFGRSGAGKSTSARLALESGWEVLSDDMNALMPQGSGWRVERLPFAGDLGQPPGPRRAYPLAGIHWLRQAPAPALAPLSRGQALGRLLACTPILNEDPYRVGLALTNLTALTAWRAPDILDFATDPGFLHLLKGPATQIEPEVPHAA